MASVDGPCPFMLVLWEEEEEEEEEEASTSSWCAGTALWARVPLSLFVVWCSCVFLAVLIVDYGGICLAGFAGEDPSRAVFPSAVVGPEMLGILAGMYQKDSGALIIDSCSDMCKARIGFTPRCVFSLGVGRPVGMSVWTRRTSMQLAGFTDDVTSCAVFSSFSSGPDARHHGQYEPEGLLQGGAEAD